jgi:quinol monooxygenase YgiN
VPYYGVAERRVRPGHMDSYLANARTIAERWATPGGQLSYRLCVADDDPDRVLLLSTWPSPAVHRAALAAMPDEMRRVVVEDTASIEQDWVWYRSLRTIERFAERAAWVVVTRIDAALADRAALDGAVRGWMDKVIARAGAVSVAYLAAVDTPTSLMTIAEYADAGALGYGAEAAGRIVDAVPPCALRRFSGRVGFLWDHIDLHRPS